MGFMISVIAAVGWVAWTPMLSILPSLDPTLKIVLYLGGGYMLAPLIALLPFFAWYTYPVLDVEARRRLSALFRTSSGG